MLVKKAKSVLSVVFVSLLVLFWSAGEAISLNKEGETGDEAEIIAPTSDSETPGGKTPGKEEGSELMGSEKEEEQSGDLEVEESSEEEVVEPPVESIQSMTLSARISDGLDCSAEYTYGLYETGNLYKMDAAGLATQVNTTRPSGRYWNSLGISSDGRDIYATADSRTIGSTTNYNVYKLNLTTGNWVNQGAVSFTTAFYIVGAVDSNEVYWYGGPKRDGEDIVFQIGNQGGEIKTIVLNRGLSGNDVGATNGDISFDAAGNLTVIQGNNSGQIIQHEITKKDFESTDRFSPELGNISSTETIQLSPSNPWGGINPNGFSLQSDGMVFLAGNRGSYSYIGSFAIPFTSSTVSPLQSSRHGYGISDLASCSPPPAIALRKNVEGRKDDADQFNLKISKAGFEISEIETKGEKLGVQGEIVGPFPTGRGENFEITESLTSSTPTDEYLSSYECHATNGLTEPEEEWVLITEGEGTSGEVTIPEVGEVGGDKNMVVCTFLNSPKGSVEWEKRDTLDGYLEGNEWVIDGGGLASPLEVKDCVEDSAEECLGHDIDPAPGKFRVSSLPVGEYTLQEVKAPEGYILEPSMQTFEITSEELNYEFKGPFLNYRASKMMLKKETCGDESGTETACELNNEGDPLWEPASGWMMSLSSESVITPPDVDEEGWAETDQEGVAGIWEIDATQPTTVRLIEDLRGYEKMYLQEVECVSPDATEKFSFTPEDGESEISLEILPESD